MRPRQRDAASAGLFVAGLIDRFEPGSVTAFPAGRFYLVRLKEGGFMALHRECTHLGCTVPWNAAQGRSACPCHASAFDITGQVLSPPAPRPLDFHAIRIENGVVKVDTAARAAHRVRGERLLGVMRGLHSFEPLRARRQWQRDAMTPFTRALEGGTLVVVGLGSIGRSVARKARAFEMRVVGVSRQGRSAPYCERVVPHTQFREVLPEADALVLALPLTEETFHLLGRNELALMKPGAVVVNIARGGLIDEPALIAALQQGRLGGAGLDVVESEPLAPGSPLWGRQNVLLTPHVAGRGGVEQDHRLAALLADNLRRFQAGRELRNRVDARTGLALDADVRGQRGQRLLYRDLARRIRNM